MKIKHLILAFGGASLLAACNLDEYPYGFYSEDNFYKTEADAESAVNYIYDAINYIEYSRSIVFLGDMNTDDMEPISGEFKNATIVEKVDSPIGDENLSHQFSFLQLTPGRESRFPDRGRKLARLFND